MVLDHIIWGKQPRNVKYIFIWNRDTNVNKKKCFKREKLWVGRDYWD